MKGIKYNCKLDIPENQQLILERLTMEELVDNITMNLKKYYHLEINITNQVIYNLLKRPKQVSKLIRGKIHLEKIPFRK